jgi:hypothetical protein
MTATEYAGKLDELERLLNDPEVPIEPSRIWSLLADISRETRVRSMPLPSNAGQTGIVN